MQRSSRVFRAGTRASKLALVQARDVLDRFRKLLPDADFQEVQFSSPGDRDRTTDLRESPPDFFTRDLDKAVLDGSIDCAIHSAKDLPEPVPAGIDWCWLPWREDQRDAVILPKGRTMADLPVEPRAGVSSGRREQYTRNRFPGARLLPIRGNIEERLALLDGGSFDVLIMAGAALVRLGLEHRVNEWIPLKDLPAPEGQGCLALTFKEGDPRFLRLRSLFVKAVCFAGAGAGSAGVATVDTVKSLARCDVCLYDTLMDPSLLDHLPDGAKRVDVGKRCGRHSVPQPEITALICDYARKGYRVVRLKGGDPGIFGRLAEEIEALDSLHLPYRVIPGVSSMSAATTGTGMLLTRRGISRGFCVMTPRQQGGGVGSVSGRERAGLPMVFFMAAGIAGDVARELIADGTPKDCPAAIVFNAGRDDETVVRGPLETIGSCVGAETYGEERPGLLIVGEVSRFGFNRDWGALRGRRVLLTCSPDLQDKASSIVTDLGGIPVSRPLIRLVPRPEAIACIGRLSDYEWLVLTSPASVRCFVEILDKAGADVRIVPKLIACGPGTAMEMRKLRLFPACEPGSNFGAEGMLQTIGADDPVITHGTRVLRLRSDKAGPDLAKAMRGIGAIVDDCILYDNVSVSYDKLPEFDDVFFASASAVEAFDELWGRKALDGKTVVVIGEPTVAGLSRIGLKPDVVSPEATIVESILALAGMHVRRGMEELT